MESSSRSILGFARMCLCAAIAIVALAAFTQDAVAKGQLIAVLDKPIPADAKPGTKVDVSWKLESKRGDKFEPFGAGEIYIRLVGRDPGQVTGSVTDGSGSYSARVTVPPSGIKRVEIGIVGTRGSGREAINSSFQIPIVGPTLDHTSSEAGDSAFNTFAAWIGIVGAIALGLLAALFLRSRRASLKTAVQ